MVCIQSDPGADTWERMRVMHPLASVGVADQLTFLFIEFMCENAGTVDCQISKTIPLTGGRRLHPKPPERGSAPAS